MTDKPSFARRVRAAKPRAKKYEIWDNVISGLGLCVRPSGVRTYFLRRMVRRRDHYATIGNAEAVTLPEARREARKFVASYFDTSRKDNGPKTPGRAMDALAAEFLERHARHWKLRTLETNERVIRLHILPAFGHLTVDAVTREQVQDWFTSMSERPGVANRAMPVLSMMMRMAELWGYRVHNTNPCTNTRRFRMTPKERFLSPDEIGRLNAVLTRDEFYCPQTVAIIRLLLLTGCRFGEIAALEWDWIEGKRIFLPDAKSGPRTVWLSSAARAVIDAIPRYSAACHYVFPGRPADRPTGDISNDWGHIRKEAGLPDVRLHDLRHTWASVAAMNGIDMVTIAKLLGHALVETTERYTHLSEHSVADAADRVSGRIQAALAGKGDARKAEAKEGASHAQS